MRQNKTAISTVIQQTGFAIRDWLGPFYTLGGVVTFAITMLTFLDPSGILVKSITALLVVATGVAWAVSRRRPADSADPATQAPPAHALLLVVTLFFTAGLVISEAIMSGKRQPVAPAAPVTNSPATSAVAPLIAPATAPQTETASTTDAAGPSGSAAVATSPVAVVPASTPAAPPSSTAPALVAPASSARPPVATAQTKPVRPPEDRARHTTTSAPRAAATSTTAARTPLSAADAQRCSKLIAKFSLGDTPSDADKHYLETSCR